MDERVIRFRVGIVVITAACITFLLVMLFSAQRRLFRSTYTVMVRFPSAPGVSENTPVRKSGIPIGRVTDVELLNDGGVRLTMQVDQDKPLFRREAPRIGPGSLVTGDANLEFVARDDADPTLIREFDTNGDGVLGPEELEVANQQIEDDEYLSNGQVARDPLAALAAAEERLGSAFSAVQDASLRFSQLVDNLNGMLNNNDDQFRRILTKTETMVGNIDLAARDMHDLFGDEQSKQKLRTAIDKLPGVVENIELAAADARDTMASFKNAGDRAERVLAGVEEIVQPLAERSDAFAENLVGITDKLDSFLLELNAVAEMLSRGEGTVGKLLREDEIYLKLRDSVERFELLTRRIEPIVADARVAVDKVARDPSILGVRGALLRRPPGAGLKTGMDFGDTQGYFPRRHELERKMPIRQ